MNVSTGQVESTSSRTDSPSDQTSLTAVEDVVEIRDPAIDVDTVMAEIRRGLVSRGYRPEDFTPEFPLFAPDGFPGPKWIDGLGLDPELAYLLEQIGDQHDRLAIPMDARTPKIPVAGRFLLRLKQVAHQLVLFYVNALGQRQVQVNTNMLRTVARLASEQAAMRQETSRLREELAALRSELDRTPLQSRQLGPPPETP